MSPETMLLNGSGGTDMCTGLVGGCLAQPVYEGEISGASLGVDAHAFDADGNEVIGELGELVITSPMPSMPVKLWGDEDGEPLPALLLRPLPGRLAPRRLDHVHRPRELCGDRTLRRDPESRRRAAGDGRVLRGDRGPARGPRRARRPPRGRRRGQRRAAAVRRSAAGVAVDDDLDARIARALRAQLSPDTFPTGSLPSRRSRGR